MNNLGKVLYATWYFAALKCAITSKKIEPERTHVTVSNKDEPTSEGGLKMKEKKLMFMPIN